MIEKGRKALFFWLKDPDPSYVSYRHCRQAALRATQTVRSHTSEVRKNVIPACF
jgi:hypothetical protein